MRWARRIAVVLAALALVGAVAAWLGLRALRSSGLPQRDGAARVAGLAAAVDVRFDAYGVPHVAAASGLDAAAAMGWLHANDRMTQLELGRRAARGRLAEVAGAAAVPLDVRARQLGLAEIAASWWSAAGARTRAELEAYARGVNAWLAARAGDLPPGLVLLRVAPEPWTPEDSLAFGALLARDLTFLPPELERFDVLRAMGPAALRDLYGAAPDAPLDPRALALAERLGPPAPRLEVRPAEDADEGAGSNNWLVSAARSATGAPLVANDPHLGLGLPSMWYQAHVRAPDYEASGMTLVGLPHVIVGQGPRVAWAVTNGGRDHQDFLWEDVADGAVLRAGERVPIAARTEEIAVRFADPVSATVERTDVGPVVRHGDDTYSLRWSAFDAFDAVAAFRDLAGARDVAAAREAIAGFVAPTQNLLLADVDGHVALTLLGRAPERPPGAGWLPRPADDPAAAWDGHRPQDAGLWVADPADGVLTTSNDDVEAGRTAHSALLGEFDTPHRARRSRELLLARTDWTAADLAALQLDRVSLFARDVLARAAERGVDPDDAGARTAWSLLSSWDGELAPDSAAAALWPAFRERLYDAVFADELQRAGVGGVGFGYDRRRRVAAALAGDLELDWFDDVGTDGVVETARERVELALREAFADTAAVQGSDDPGSWRYGRARSWTLAHPLSPLPAVGRAFTRGPLEIGGSASTLLATAGRRGPDGRERVEFGPSMRWVADLADPDRSVACLPGGQSGHPFDPHYDDQLDDFLSGRTHPARWTETAIEAGAVSRLRLEP